MNRTKIVELGDLAQDEVSGMQGVAVAEYRYLNGCVQFNLQPRKLKDGMPVASVTFDVGQLKVLKKRVCAALVSDTGGPAIAPTPRTKPQARR